MDQQDTKSETDSATFNEKTTTIDEPVSEGTTATVSSGTTRKTTPYFFYGSLQHPVTLYNVLRYEVAVDDILLVPASITGLKIKMWGLYPALVDCPDNVVTGMVYKVKSQNHEQYLAYYETGNYTSRSVKIKLEDGREIDGKTFVWAGDTNELEDGTFDLTEYQNMF